MDSKYINRENEESSSKTHTAASNTTTTPTITNQPQIPTNDYGWLVDGAEINEITATKRMARFKDNQSRIAEIGEEMPWYVGWANPNFVENWFLSPEQEALRDELESLKAENNMYKNSQFATDSYYVPETEEFLQNAAYRDYTNASKEELWNYDMSTSEGSTALSNGGYFDEAGNIRYCKGEIVQSANAPVVQDKLGMFLSTSDEEIAEAYNRLSATNGNYTDTWANLIQEGDTNGWKYLEENEI